MRLQIGSKLNSISMYYYVTIIITKNKINPLSQRDGRADRQEGSCPLPVISVKKLYYNNFTPRFIFILVVSRLKGLL